MIATDLVGIKGGRSGLLVSIRDDCDFLDGLAALRDRILENGSFFKGSPISLDLGWRELREDEFHALMAMLEEHGLNMLGVISVSLTTRRLLEGRGIKVIIGRLGLAQHQGRQRRPGEAPPAPPPPPAPEGPPGGRRGENAAESHPSQPVVVEVGPEVAPPVASVVVAETVVAPAPLLPLGGEPAVVLRKTLRSGQRVDYDGNVIILGDINAGAQVEASGDILIMGSLRGSVHAGARGRVGASIYVMGLHVAQVRIAGVPGDVPLRMTRSGVCTQLRLEDGRITFTALKQL